MAQITFLVGLTCRGGMWVTRNLLLRKMVSTTSAQRLSSTFAFDKTLINGKWVGATSGKTFPVLNPSTGDVIADVPEMGQSETQEAIQGAYEAFQTWRERTPKERSDILRQWFNLIMANKDELSRILTLENGKVLAEAEGEVIYGASFVDWFADEARRIFGDVVPTSKPNNRVFHLKQPVGVCGLITPFNFPNAMITRKVAPALAAGCSVVLRPSEDTPLSAIALTQLADQAGVPAGVINLVTSSRDNAAVVGDNLCNSTLVQKISFTGSTVVGKMLLKQCADTVKRVSMELGGNAPFIVFDSADVDKAVQGALLCKFRSTGQTCISANRMLVQDGIHDRFVAGLHEAISKLRTGDGLDSNTTQGPLINARAAVKVSSLVEDAVSKGATVHNGGKGLGGNFFENTLLSGITLDMRIAKEEIFGPVVPVIRFKTEEEALTIANSTNVGLAGYFYSQDLSQIMRVAEKLEMGMIGANETMISGYEGAFGGVKQSGMGREGSIYGIDEFLELKLLSIGI